MCSPLKRTFFQLALLLICVHHSHQAENLDQDVTQDHHRSDHDYRDLIASLKSDSDHLEVQECGKVLEKHFTFVEPHQHPVESQRSLVWGLAVGAISAIALCDIFAVLAVPIIQRLFYQHLIQFLIALAIGTLLGDALLHLVPHALMHELHSHDGDVEGFHQASVWRGLTAVGSLMLFFVSERVINKIGEWRDNRKKAKETAKDKVKVVRTGHRNSKMVVGERICKHKYSSYCVDDINEISDEKKLPNGATNSAASSQAPLLPALSDSCLLNGGTHPKSKHFDRKNGKRVSEVQDQLATIESVAAAGGSEDEEYKTVFLREHEHVHHGHSHAHTHIHSAPDSISSVAWMVLLGDGFHSFADGMAVGAAFSESVTSGFSTAIAVLCHELPHEVGDFAMLLRAGMSIKQAVFYNLLSSLVSYLGMVVGILLAGNENVVPWIFMATAGIFIYIALVDMMPELNSGHAHPISDHAQHDSHLQELGLQLLGMGSGVTIMLLIALYEENLTHLFD